MRPRRARACACGGEAPSCIRPLITLLLALLGGRRGGSAQPCRCRRHSACPDRRPPTPTTHTPTPEQALGAFASAQGERMLETPGNPISLAMTLDSLRPGGQRGVEEGGAAKQQQPAGEGESDEAETEGEQPQQQQEEAARGGGGRPPASPTFLGAMLFQRGVSGARVVARGASAEVAGLRFEG